MSAIQMFGLLLVIFFLVAITIAVFKHDQRVWRRCCACKRNHFFDWPEARCCRYCGRLW